MGTAEFAVPTLERLAETRHRVLAVYTQPPRPAGRGHQPRRAPIHQVAAALGLEVATPERLSAPDEQRALQALGADAIIVAAYGLILPDAVLATPRLGCINLHGSLLPRWRGAAPIQRTIIAGDTESGVTIIQMDAGIDTGPILARRSISVPGRATAESLNRLLAQSGAELMVETLDRLAANQLKPESQPCEGACYAKKIRKDEGRLDWGRSAYELDCLSRGLSPWPGAYLVWGGDRIKVLVAEPIDSCKGDLGPPGTLLTGDFTVACAKGALRLVRVQRAGRAPVDGASFLRGARIAVGTVFPCPDIG